MKENKANCHPELDSGSRCSIKGFTLNRHAESSLLSISTATKAQSRDPEQKPFGMALCKGFTLIELLIVVLIIGILSAIAVPQYQKAVLKSRFSSLMPTTQAIRDGNEMYYMTNGGYADAIAKLDVTSANTDDMTITLSDDEDYAYTMATRPNINNNLIMYQKHSVNFPGEIHCEALKGNKQATWLCEKALHGTKIGGSLTTGYSEYILEGSGKGVTVTVSEELAGVACPEGSAEDACKVTENEDGSKTKMVCTTPGTATTCTYTTTNTDGSTTVCKGQYAKYENGKCIPTKKGTYEVTTDEDGNRVSKNCDTFSSGKCSKVREYGFDANGKQTSSSDRSCSSWNEDGSCSAYSSGNDYTWEYDANGKQTSYSSRTCSSFNTDGSCGAYSSGTDYTYEYNANGKKTSESYRTCSSFNTDGSCSAYSSGNDYTYEYNANGKQTSSSSRTCSSFNTDGSCGAYSSGTDYTYEYNANGKQTSFSSRTCSSFKDDGVTCSAYSGGSITDYTTSPNTTTRCNSEAECAELFGIPLPAEE